MSHKTIDRQARDDVVGRRDLEAMGHHWPRVGAVDLDEEDGWRRGGGGQSTGLAVAVDRSTARAQLG